MIYNAITNKYDFNGAEVNFANNIAVVAENKPVQFSINDIDVTVTRENGEFVAKAVIGGELKFIYNTVAITVILEMMIAIKETETAAKCDLCSKPLNGEQSFHKACADYEQFVADSN